MAGVIEGDALRALRMRKGWSQKEAAGRARMSLRQYQRLERPGRHTPHDRVFEAIRNSFAVEAADLAVTSAGEETTDREPLFANINVSVGLYVRNMFFLNTLRYGVTLTDQIAWGAALFALFAEESFQWRRARVARLRESLRVQEENGRDLAMGVPFRILLRVADEYLSREEESIARHDLFDLPHHDGKLETMSPFTKFIVERLRQYGEVFDPVTVNGICVPDIWDIYADKEIDRLLGLGGDTAPLAPIVSGFVALHEMPEELLKDGSPSDRAAWILEHDQTREANGAVPEWGEENPCNNPFEEIVKDQGSRTADMEEAP